MTNYTHVYQDGSPCNLPLRKIVCVGRNYAAHARELGNAVPETPILFMKPATALVTLAEGFVIPADRGECHHETEVTVLIGKTLKNASEEQCRAAIAGLGLGLDLTLRDLQNELKKKGQPWEVAKAFDGAAPLSAFLKPEGIALDDMHFMLTVNGELRQRGHSADMITPILPLLAHISGIFTLEPGDVVMTGTPEGVAPLQSGDTLLLEMAGLRVTSAVL